MDNLPNDLRVYLSDAAGTFRELGLPNALADQMDRLAIQVDEPCVVAVVGRMKAGKSTFINALLGEDLAKVGATETTATINYFRYGRPHPTRPVRCHWQNGTVTDEELAFVDSLHGNDVETLRRASGIQHLEFRLLNPFLARVTLVDTPGLCAVVDAHVERTAEFLALQGNLRERHNAETTRLGSDADAVIYLTGQVARATDQMFLDEFKDTTSGRARALNAIGILAKIDLLPEILQRREELATRIGHQLKDQLNRVLPVSAGIKRALDKLEQRQSFSSFVSTLSQIPIRRLEKFLASEEFFRELEVEDSPVRPADRARLLGDMPWAVFTAMARTAKENAFDAAKTVERLRSLSGFDSLHELLDRHFVRRAQFLRCHRIAREARKTLDDVRFRHLPQRRQQDRDRQAMLDRFRAFIRSFPGNPAVATELDDFLSRHLQSSVGLIESARTALDRKLATLERDLDEMNSDFEALQILSDHADEFSQDEREELNCLFGLYGPETRLRGLDVEGIANRQNHWLRVQFEDICEYRRLAAEHAISVYGSRLARK